MQEIISTDVLQRQISDIPYDANNNNAKYTANNAKFSILMDFKLYNGRMPKW